MGSTTRGIGSVLVASTLAFSLAPAAVAQDGRVGVVTNVEGVATVARLTVPQPQRLRFRDEVFLHDRITTGERSIVRVLLGGKATVTARERSVVTITEVPGVATVELSAGRISVAVSKAMMKPGEAIEIKTPNAITAIRGTVVVAEVVPGASVRSTMTVLRGLIEVTRLDLETGREVGRPVGVDALQAITIAGTHPLSAPITIGVDEAKRLRSEFRIVPSDAPSAAAVAVERAVQQATEHAEALVSAPGGVHRHRGDGEHGNGHHGNGHSGRGHGHGGDASGGSISGSVVASPPSPVPLVDATIRISHKAAKK